MFPFLIVPLLAAAAVQQPPLLLPDVAALASAIEPETASGSSLRLLPLLEAVRERNPDLIALDEERAASLDRAIAAGAFPNPGLGFAIRNVPVDSFSFSEDMMTMKEVMVSQQFPWFGKRELRREMVEQNAALAEAEKAAQQLTLEEAATSAYANLWLANASVEVVNDQKKALERFSRIARGRYAAGGGSQSDLLRADVELVRIEDPLLELEDMDIAARATLASLMYVQMEDVQGAPEAPPLPPLPSEPEALLARVEAHPDVRALEERAKQSEIEARLELRNRWPDPEIELMYGQRSHAPDMVGAEIMFHIPIFAGSKENKLAAAAKADARAALNRRDALVRRMQGEARSALSGAKRQRELMRLYDDEIIPRAERNLVSATGSYQAGAVDFLTLLDARVQLQSQQLEALRARANYVRQLARLSRATGISLLDSWHGAPDVGSSEVKKNG